MKPTLVALLSLCLCLAGCSKKITEEDVVGIYDYSTGAKPLETDLRFVFLDNGVLEVYTNGQKTLDADNKWTIVDNEIHTEKSPKRKKIGISASIHRVNSDGSISVIGMIEAGERVLYKEGLYGFTTFKKIK